LVVAFALAGRIDIDFESEPLGMDRDGNPVFLRDLWPSPVEIRETVARALVPKMFEDRYGEVFKGDEHWQALPLPKDGNLYDWTDTSTYIRKPTFFDGMTTDVPAPGDIEDARVLAVLGHTVTTDHISPAGAIPKNEPAGVWLREHGVEPVHFNTFGSRRGNHEVMVRGTFGNVRMRNLLLKEKEGGYTVHHPTGDVLSIFEASERYRESGTPLIILAGGEYGAGSSRDWAAKGTFLLGVKAVIAESYERIHRSNLVGMGVLPLKFEDGATPTSLGLDGTETFSIEGIATGLAPRSRAQVSATRADGSSVSFQVEVRLESDVELEYYRNGGILHTVLRKIARGEM